MNCEASSIFEGISSDHRIVSAKIRLSLAEIRKKIGNAK